MVQRCLASIARHAEGGPAAEVIVLANGTPPVALGPLTSRDDIVLLRSAVNHGFGGGCNWAARYARGQRLLFLNDDATVTAGWLTALYTAMDTDERLGVAGSRILLADGRLQEVGDVIWSDGSTSHLGRGLPADAAAHLGLRDVDYVSFCSAMVRRQTWDDVGGFDERYFPAYYEDADLCLSARSLGWRVVCEPASVVVHHEGGSTAVRFRHFVSHRNRQLFVDKWRGTLAGLDQRPARVVPGIVLTRTAQPLRTSSVVPATSPAAVARTHSQSDVDEVEAMSVEARHLADDIALKEEYIAFLSATLDEYGMGDLAQHRYRALRGELARLARSNPRVAAAVEALKARIGERTSQ